MNAYVINLVRRPDRWARMQELWEPFFTLVRWPAVDVKGNGARGCKESHVGLAEHVLSTSTSVIVLEDDAVPTRKFKECGLEIIAEALKHLDHWDYINCGPCLDPKFTKRKQSVVTPSVSEMFMRVDFSYRTHFVMYNRASLPLLRASMESAEEIDLFLGHNSRRQWVPKHVLAVQSDSQSDIHKSDGESRSGYLTTEQMLQQIKPMTNKPCLACYLPPSDKRSTEPFLQNLKRCQPIVPLLLFTDSQEYASVKPTMMKASPEVAAPGVNQLVFLSACLLAARKGFSHMILLEWDCRMADGFDQTIWNEYLAAGKPNAIGGTVILRHVHAMTGHARRDALELKAKNFEKNLPVAEYGSTSSPLPHHPSVTVCPPLGVYPVLLMDELFKLSEGHTVDKARKMQAVDREIGKRLWDKYGGAVFDAVVQLDCVFSTHHDQVTDEDTRCTWLNEGKVVAIHPVKSDWNGPLEYPLLRNLEGLPTGSTHDYFPPPPGFTLNTGKESGEAAGVAPVQTRKEDTEQVVSDKPASVSSAAPAAKPSCVCGEPETLGIVHRTDGPCYVTAAEPLIQVMVDKRLNKIKGEMTSMRFAYRMDIIIVTQASEADWLELCLRSIGKFCQGFGAITVVYPEADTANIAPIIERFRFPFPYDINVVFGSGVVTQTCIADLHCPDADLVLHVSAHCIFFRSTSPEDYFHAGKPVLTMTPYEPMRETNKPHFNWKAVTEGVFKEPVHYSTMEGFPVLHWRELYPSMRGFVELRQSVRFEYFVEEEMAAFTLLGAYALRSREFIDRYHFLNLSRAKRLPDRLIEFQHGSLDEMQPAPARLPSAVVTEGGTVVPRVTINTILEIQI